MEAKIIMIQEFLTRWHDSTKYLWNYRASLTLSLNVILKASKAAQMSRSKNAISGRACQCEGLYLFRSVAVSNIITVASHDQSESTHQWSIHFIHSWEMSLPSKGRSLHFTDRLRRVTVVMSIYWLPCFRWSSRSSPVCLLQASLFSNSPTASTA